MGMGSKHGDEDGDSSGWVVATPVDTGSDDVDLVQFSVAKPIPRVPPCVTPPQTEPPPRLIAHADRVVGHSNSMLVGPIVDCRVTWSVTYASQRVRQLPIGCATAISNMDGSLPVRKK